MKGILYGVGVGPGDPELLTVKAVNIITRCPVVAAPDSGGKEQLALRIAGEYIKDKEILLCSLPMTRDSDILARSHKKAAEHICAVLDKGKDVAFLTLGDPSIYATYSYLHRLVEEMGYEAVMVPGIPSFCAAAAALGQPLCEGEQPLHILPASDQTLSDSLELSGGKVVMKLGRKRNDVLKLLAQKGLLKQAAMVERCTMADENIIRDLSNVGGDSGYFSILVIKEET